MLAKATGISGKKYMYMYEGCKLNSGNLTRNSQKCGHAQNEYGSGEGVLMLMSRGEKIVRHVCRVVVMWS